MTNCTTHHKACDCREAMFAEILEVIRDAEWALEGMVEYEDLGDECPRIEGFELCGATCCEHSGCAVERLQNTRALIARATDQGEMK